MLEHVSKVTAQLRGNSPLLWQQRLDRIHGYKVRQFCPRNTRFTLPQCFPILF